MSPVTYVTCTLSDIYVACNIFVACNIYVTFKWLASGKRATVTATATATAIAVALSGLT